MCIRDRSSVFSFNQSGLPAVVKLQGLAFLVLATVLVSSHYMTSEFNIHEHEMRITTCSPSLYFSQLLCLLPVLFFYYCMAYFIGINFTVQPICELILKLNYNNNLLNISILLPTRNTKFFIGKNIKLLPCLLYTSRCV